MCSASITPPLLLEWSILGCLLLSRVQTGVVACVIPRHHYVLEVFILYCQNSVCYSCQMSPHDIRVNACQVRYVPVPRMAWGMGPARRASWDVRAFAPGTEPSCCSEVFDSCLLSNKDRQTIIVWDIPYLLLRCWRVSEIAP